MKLKVNCTLSIDWEGHSLIDANINAMDSFNRKFPYIPKVQFINPAYYFTIEHRDHLEITKTIHSAIGERDELGLHIHPWREFIDAVGIQFRDRPSYLHGGKTQEFAGLIGGDIPLTSYDESEIEKIISFSMDVLSKEGFDEIKYYRGGGWISGPKVYRVLMKNSVFCECSPVPEELVARLYPDTLLQSLARDNWPQVNIHSLPSDIESGKMRQYPNNLCLADYVDSSSALSLFKKIVARALDEGISEIYIHYGWHQESAMVSLKTKSPIPTSYLKSVEEFLNSVQLECESQGYELNFPVLSTL